MGGIGNVCVSIILRNNYIPLLTRQPVKSPESHLARSYVLRSLSHVDFDYTEIDRMLGIEICLSNDSKSVVRFQQLREAFSVSDKK